MYNESARFFNGPRTHFCTYLFVIVSFAALLGTAFSYDNESLQVNNIEPPQVNSVIESQVEIEQNEADARDKYYFHDAEPTTRTNCAPTRETFMSCVSYMVREENWFIQQHRSRIISIEVALDVGSFVDPFALLWLESMHRKYNTTSNKELLLKLGPIPVEMAIAQSILESGWGTSYAARVGKGLFGQIQSSGTHDVSVPWKPAHDMPQPFKSHRDSVTAYFINLNTHTAYHGFRIARQETDDPLVLIKHMTRYSIRKQAYIKEISGIIKSIKDKEYDLWQ